MSDFKLMDAFRKTISKVKDKGIANQAEFDVAYSTGFLGLDYLNGNVVHVQSKDINLTYNSVGILDGSANTFIGRSGCGKSTFVLQVAANIVKQFPESCLYIDDIEGSLPASRKEFLLGMTNEEMKTKVDMRNTGITTENVFQRIKALHDIKLENRPAFEYDTGLYDTFGNRIFKLIPSVYVIDSLPMLMPDDITEDDELAGSMGASSIAKKNTQLVKKICQLLKEANIILFTINHIMDDIVINPMARKQAQVAGLGQGERLPGGKAAVYLANNLFRIDDKMTLKSTEGYGIDGSICYIKIIKSRSNKTLRSVPIIFNKSEGRFDDILSLYQLLKEEGRIGGAGAYMYIQSAPNIKFQQKVFKEKLYASPELQTAFAKECNDVLSSFLFAIKNQELEEARTVNINNMILSMNTVVASA